MPYVCIAYDICRLGADLHSVGSAYYFRVRSCTSCTYSDAVLYAGTIFCLAALKYHITYALQSLTVPR